MEEFIIIASILFVLFSLIVTVIEKIREFKARKRLEDHWKKQLDDLGSFEEDIINSKKSCCNCHGGCAKSIINSELEYCQDDE